MVRFMLAMTLVFGAVLVASPAQANLSSADRQLIEQVLDAYARGQMAQDILSSSAADEDIRVSRTQMRALAQRARADVTRQFASFPAAYRERVAQLMISWIRENLGTVRQIRTTCVDRNAIAQRRYSARNMDPYSDVLYHAVGCLCANADCDENGSTTVMAELATCDYTNFEQNTNNCPAYTVQYAQSGSWRFIPVIIDEEAFHLGQGRPYVIRMDWVELESGVVPTSTRGTVPRARY